MSYDVAEQSVHDGAPVECYKFTGTFRTYRYTSSSNRETVNGEEYQPVAGKRGTIRSGTQADDSLALEITLPFNLDVVQDYGYAESPPSLTLEVYRVHRNTNFATDWVLLWKGEVTAFNIKGRKATVRVPSIFSRALQGDLPNVYYQGPCNHVLYDSLCKVSRATHSVTTTTTDVQTLAFSVIDDGGVDGVLAAGEAVCTRTGERRLILNNLAGTVTIGYPFVDLRVGDEVELTKGCDHSFTTCKAKFGNAANFGGDPYIPADNPFMGDVS